MPRRLAGPAAALLAVSVLPGCVPREDVQFAFDSARFNERIRRDLDPLTVDDLGVDGGFGFFRDGADGGLVSELFPVAAGSTSSGSGTGGLVQTPCLFVGNELFDARRSGGDEMRLAWEVVGNFDRNSSEFAEKNFTPGYEELGMCTLSSPVSRLLFENPDAPLRGASRCSDNYGPFSGFAFTLKKDGGNANIPLDCLVGYDRYEVVLEAFTPRQADPDGLCPAAGTHFADRSTVLDEAAPACGMPGTGVEPVEDTSYRLSLQAGHSFGPGMPERWLSPNVMPVNDVRDVVRPMRQPLPGAAYKWETPVMRLDADGPAQWGENYTPTVHVYRVEILSRDGSGNEVVEQPDAQQLRIVIPQPIGDPHDVTCTGSVKDGRFSFAIPQDCHIDDVQLGVLTPTYAPTYLFSSPPVTTPIGWYVDLPRLAPDRAPFIRFSLNVVAEGAALRISPARHFGPVQVDRWRQGELVLENIGGADVEVRSVAFTPTSVNPGDFSFVVAGDPVPMPLPIEVVPDPGGTLLQLAGDPSDAPILRVDDRGDEFVVTLGDPARESGTEPLVLYGQGARLVGNLLLRDDPAAVFTPAGRHPRPLSLPAFAEQQPPFVLAAGDSVKIFVIARPTALGTRRADIRVEAVPIGSPVQTLRVTSQVSAVAVSGPRLYSLPAFLYFGRSSSDQARHYTKVALLTNNEHFDVNVTRISITGRDAARFTYQLRRRPRAPFTLVSGDYEDVAVTYTPVCDGTYDVPDHEATLLVESNGGNAVIPLYGSGYGFCELP